MSKESIENFEKDLATLIQSYTSDPEKVGDEEVDDFLRTMLHTCGHFAVAIGVSTGDYAGLAMDELEEARKCLANTVTEKLLESLMSARAETLPDEEKN